MRPSKPILQLARRCALLIMRPWAHTSVLVRALIVLQEDAVITAAIGDFGISRLRHAVSAFAISDPVPGAQRNHSSAVCARPFKRTFVLLRAVDMVRELVVNIDVVELRGGLIVLGAPGLTAIARHGRAAVVA